LYQDPNQSVQIGSIFAKRACHTLVRVALTASPGGRGLGLLTALSTSNIASPLYQGNGDFP
jgi:hypothetical protein